MEMHTLPGCELPTLSFVIRLLQREDDFLKRLQKYRFTNINKFDDDYYGDKVKTLADYRQWVRQQQRKKEIAKSTQEKLQ